MGVSKYNILRWAKTMKKSFLLPLPKYLKKITVLDDI